VKIALIFNRENESTTGVYMEKVIKAAGIECQHFWTEHADQIPREFDLYLRVDHGDYKFDLPEDMHPAAFYVIDAHLKKPYKKIRHQVKHYDIVFCAVKEKVAGLSHRQLIDVQYLPLGCDPEVHKKQNLPEIYDIGFVGRDAQKFVRGKYLNALKARYASTSYIAQAPFTEMSRIYSSSKIGFNCSLNNGLNMRVFEILSCGCFLLTNRLKYNVLEDLFEVGEHLVTYNNEKELFEAIEYYLEHEQEREKIAAAGHKHALNTLTYFHMMQKMFNYCAYKFGSSFNKLRI